VTENTTRHAQLRSRQTGLQMAVLMLDALLDASREASPREHAVFVDIASRRLNAERERIKFSLRRWAA
jgi:hypothetical protein